MTPVHYAVALCYAGNVVADDQLKDLQNDQLNDLQKSFSELDSYDIPDILKYRFAKQLATLSLRLADAEKSKYDLLRENWRNERTEFQIEQGVLRSMFLQEFYESAHLSEYKGSRAQKWEQFLNKDLKELEVFAGCLGLKKGNNESRAKVIAKFMVSNYALLSNKIHTFGGMKGSRTMEIAGGQRTDMLRERACVIEYFAKCADYNVMVTITPTESPGEIGMEGSGMESVGMEEVGMKDLGNIEKKSP
ncbi:hypothetical protein HDU97_000163 [Phlyctochytrium planicorne]|nr:hypothetical protein HDU97_000163 [Phlyctochytrium planicorne]